MSKQDNIAATQHLGESVNSGNLNALHDVFASTVIDRQTRKLKGARHCPISRYNTTR
jgi:hypothetical protein